MKNNTHKALWGMTGAALMLAALALAACDNGTGGGIFRMRGGEIWGNIGVTMNASANAVAGQSGTWNQ